MSLTELLNALADAATVLGIPIAIILFVNEKRRERREREYGTYHALDEKWTDFLKLCMQYPEFDLYDLPLGRKIRLSPEQRIRQFAMFEILLSLLERAFLMYRDQSNRIKKAQWAGWNEYMHDYAERETFRRLWQLRGKEYDEEFMKHMNAIVASIAEE